MGTACIREADVKRIDYTTPGRLTWPAPAASTLAESPHAPRSGPRAAYDDHGNVRPADVRWHTGDPEPDTPA